MEYSKAYGLLEIKEADDEKRIIKGIASTPTPDRCNDIVDSTGAKFTLPMPFLWQHQHDKPIGEVVAATVTEKGIEVEIHIAKVSEEGKLKDRIDEAWQSIKMGLVKGLSIGFRGIEYNFIESTNGIHFKEWDWYELSAVTIPANMEASITSVKQVSTDVLNQQVFTPPQQEEAKDPVGCTTVNKTLIVKLNKRPAGKGIKL